MYLHKIDLSSESLIQISTGLLDYHALAKVICDAYSEGKIKIANYILKPVN